MTWIITTDKSLSDSAVEHITDELAQWVANPRSLVLQDGLVLHDTETGRSYGGNTARLRARVADQEAVDGTQVDDYDLAVGQEVEILGFVPRTSSVDVVIAVNGYFRLVPWFYFTPIEPQTVVAV